MNRKKKTIICLIAFLVAVAVCSGAVLAASCAHPDEKPHFTITLKFYNAEMVQSINTEMLVGVDASVSILEAIQAKLGNEWIDLYRDNFHGSGQLTDDAAAMLNRVVSENVVIEIVYPLQSFASSASRL